MKALKLLLTFAFIISLINSQADAMAYINPGSGSDIFQMFLSAISGFLLVFKKLFTSIKNLFKKSTKEKTDKYE